MRKQIYISVIIMAVSMIWSCGDDIERNREWLFGSGEPNHEERLAFAWKKFTYGDYLGARDIFEDLIENNVLLVDAYTGLGWCNANLNLPDTAMDNFQEALNNQPSDKLMNDIYAGLSFIYDAQNLPNECLAATERVDSAWKFDYRVDLDYKDIVLLRAMNHYARGDFTSSLSEVRRLDPSFNTQVSTVEGRAALADKIETLRSSV